MPGHRTGVAEAEVDVLVAVDVAESRPLRGSPRTRGTGSPTRSSTASAHPRAGRRARARTARASADGPPTKRRSSASVRLASRSRSSDLSGSGASRPRLAAVRAAGRCPAPSWPAARCGSGHPSHDEPPRTRGSGERARQDSNLLTFGFVDRAGCSVELVWAQDAAPYQRLEFVWLRLDSVPSVALSLPSSRSEVHAYTLLLCMESGTFWEILRVRCRRRT